MSDLDVSFVIPTCRREIQLREAISSVLRQSGVTLQVIVVDDSGQATARDAVASVGDARVLYTARKEPSSGRPALVRNEGGRLAQGRYLYFLDDDDLPWESARSIAPRFMRLRPTAGPARGVFVCK